VKPKQLPTVLVEAGFPAGDKQGQQDWVLRELCGALQVYDYDLKVRESRSIPVPANAIPKLIKTAKSLLQQAEQLSLIEEMLLETRKQQPLQRELRAFVLRASRIHKGLSAAMAKSQGGRPKDPLDTLLGVIIVQWLCAFDEAGVGRSNSRAGYGGDKFSGPLLDFAAAVLDSHPVDYTSREALGKRLHQKLVHWREHLKNQKAPGTPNPSNSD
jgi:hypothetical protein